MSDKAHIVGGRYEIIGPLGRGGMGEVFLANDASLDRKVAIKYLRGDLPEGNWHERMHAEARLLAQLSHPNIVQIHDILDEDGVPAMVMEHIDGRNLFVYMREHRSDLTQRLRWLSQIASGIAASHAAGISHRDLKAENVLIGPGKIAKVTDFGIASEDSDPQADIEALGNLAESVLADDIDDVAPSVRFLLDRLREQNPAARPDAAEAAQELQLAYYESTQQETPLPGQYEKHQQMQGRKRRFALAAGAVLAIASAITWYALKPVAVMNVAVASPSIASAAGVDQRNARLLSTALTQSLRQNVIDSPSLALVSYSEQESEAQEPAAILQLLGADSLLIPNLDCDNHTCELSLERVDTPDARVTRQVNTTLLLDSAINASEVVTGQWATLFPDSKLAARQAQDVISEEDYRVYLDMYLAHEQNSLSGMQMAAELQDLLARAPAYAPAYILFAQVSYLAYQIMSDPAYLEALESTLERGNRLVSDPGLLNYAWFELYFARGDTDAMLALRSQIIEDNPSPALASYLQGRVESSGQDFAAAAASFQRAVRIQPTSEHYYALARSEYFGGQPGMAASSLEQLIERFPYHAPGLNLLAVLAFEKWELSRAIELWERSLAIQEDPLVRSNLGSAYLYTRDYETARGHFALALEANSQDAIMILNLADAESLLGNPDRARELYLELHTRYAAKDPTVFPEAAAQAAAHLGYFEEAVATIKSQDTDFRGNPLKNFSDALVYTLAGQTLAAIVEIDSAVSAGLTPHLFDLPWFDGLCTEQRFSQIMVDAGNTTRCPDA